MMGATTTRTTMDLPTTIAAVALLLIPLHPEILLPAPVALVRSREDFLPCLGCYRQTFDSILRNSDARTYIPFIRTWNIENTLTLRRQMMCTT